MDTRVDGSVLAVLAAYQNNLVRKRVKLYFMHLHHNEQFVICCHNLTV